jgi:hypothetical protein
MEASQSKVISIPFEYSATKRKLIGEDVVNFIVKRTQSGIDVNGNLFAGYSKNYEKSGTVDLTISEQMLSNLKLLSHGPGFIRIGFDSSRANNKAGWIQAPRGQKADTPARTFVGISQSDLNFILANYPL